MLKKTNIRLKRHETFSIREGWMEKALHNYSSNENDDFMKCFSKDNGQRILGIGTNMVKSLRYWMEACCIIKFNQHLGNELTVFGKYLADIDPFLSNLNSWWLIHLFLSTNEKDAPVINSFFNSDVIHFEKDQIFNLIKKDLEKKYDLKNEASLESDINVLVKTYFADDISNPEDNLNCPLTKLGLLGFSNKIYERRHPKYSKLNYKIVYLCILKCVNSTSFNLEDLYEMKNNPLKIFNLSKSSLFQYLTEIKKAGYISLIKTAGLNTITILHKIDFNDLR